MNPKIGLDSELIHRCITSVKFIEMFFCYNFSGGIKEKNSIGKKGWKN